MGIIVIDRPFFFASWFSISSFFLLHLFLFASVPLTTIVISRYPLSYASFSPSLSPPLSLLPFLPFTFALASAFAFPTTTAPGATSAFSALIHSLPGDRSTDSREIQLSQSSPVCFLSRPLEADAR
ncbi:uncharacterized protein BDV14DRAFT_115252 [Aspergillus stella-maris]|uniref:uncharacterized protein n=1 Tax=Aspergillus stella-maris TaxID=1810926 RepID=UPI003CCD6436